MCPCEPGAGPAGRRSGAGRGLVGVGLRNACVLGCNENRNSAPRAPAIRPPVVRQATTHCAALPLASGPISPSPSRHPLPSLYQPERSAPHPQAAAAESAAARARCCARVGVRKRPARCTHPEKHRALGPRVVRKPPSPPSPLSLAPRRRAPTGCAALAPSAAQTPAAARASSGERLRPGGRARVAAPAILGSHPARIQCLTASPTGPPRLSQRRHGVRLRLQHPLGRNGAVDERRPHPLGGRSHVLHPGHAGLLSAPRSPLSADLCPAAS